MATAGLPPFTKKTDQELKAAFLQDGFEVTQTVTYQGQRGFAADSKTATNSVTGQPKRVYYVEGSSYQMGYLLGMMAHEAIERMVTDFELGIIPSMLPGHPGRNMKFVWETVIGWVGKKAYAIKRVVPDSMMQELQGMRDACRTIKPRSKVGVKRLLTLNMGIDILLSIAYDPLSILYDLIGLDPEHVHIPVFCNGYVALSGATKDGKTYMGRDFMFPTANVFQDLACMVIYNPSDRFTVNGKAQRRMPVLAMTAPGFVGCIAGLNPHGIGVGVDMLPGANNNPKNPGLNSLMLVRHASDFGQTAQGALDLMVEAPRGVSWLYLVGDDAQQRAVVAEAGMRTNTFDPFSYPDSDLFKDGLLPDQAFFAQHDSSQPQQGLVARWNDYTYPQAFLPYNEALFKKYGKTYNTGMMAEKGYINTGFISGSYKEPGWDNNPEAYYFAPQRETRSDLVLVTNMAVTPTMRLCGMLPFTVKLAGTSNLAQMQWRYDTLNKLLLDAAGTIDAESAWALIDYLSPYRSFPNFYGHGHTPDQYKDIQIGGSTSLLNLTDKTMKSHYGYFGDDPVTLSLLPYVS